MNAAIHALKNTINELHLDIRECHENLTDPQTSPEGKKLWRDAITSSKKQITEIEAAIAVLERANQGPDMTPDIVPNPMLQP